MTKTLCPALKSMQKKYVRLRARAARAYMKRIRRREEPWYGDSQAARVVQAADCFGVTLACVEAYPHMLNLFGLDHPVDQETCSQAAHLLHKWDNQLSDRGVALQPKKANADAVDDGEGVGEGFVKRTGDRPPVVEPKTTKTKKEKKTRVTKDQFGSREGSKSYKLNGAILVQGATTAKEMSKRSGETLSRAKAHIKWLAARGFITIAGDGFVVGE